MELFNDNFQNCIYWFIKFGWYTTAFMFVPLGIFSWLIRDTIKQIKEND